MADCAHCSQAEVDVPFGVVLRGGFSYFLLEAGEHEEGAPVVEEDPADGGAVPAVEPPPPLAADDGAEGFGVVRVGEAVALHG